jgi:hypothetical protein
VSLASFTCPRCRAEVEARFYGPCDQCRGVLRALGGEARAVEIGAYEPKMNVTPNQVATKD